ncbi:MAG: aldo/keto reductase [Gemmatimonadetes bacterium]|nr:aldo/keto reductase [Gemmatimonadota bacterium]MYB97355.1 aldo/keto reductase [Gemmatimonadota bacterium]MYI47335.1 aldo/keto reductase [Gemmatimonadota bacterium]
MLTRRDWLRTTAAAGAAVSLSPRMLGALRTQDLITRAVPSTGEQLPIIGLGSSATFRRVAGGENVAALGEVLKTFTDNGATVFDTAPSYGASEEVSGQLATEMGITDQIFWATKVNVAGRGGGSADPDRARAQIERSFGYFGVDVMDLIQVHNLGDPPVQVGILEELKAEGRIRYLGITSTSKRQYPALAQAMQDYPLDFIGIDYALNNTSAADDIFPIAQDQGIGILVYVPFGRNLFTRASGQEVPEWAAEFGATSWAQFFLKFAAAHPAVTCVTPATSQARHMLDNIGAARGRLPNEDEQARMLEVEKALPPAPRRRG